MKRFVFAIVLIVSAASFVHAQDDQKSADPKPAAAEPAKPAADVAALQQQVKELEGKLQQLASQTPAPKPAEQLKAVQDALTATLKSAYDQASAGCKALGAREITLSIAAGQPSFSCVVRVK